MPLQEHPDQAISRTDPDNDVAWMIGVLSPSAADVPAVPTPPFSLDYASALELEHDLPSSSFRLQFLRAWIAAGECRPAEVAGHA